MVEERFKCSCGQHQLQLGLRDEPEENDIEVSVWSSGQPEKMPLKARFKLAWEALVYGRLGADWVFLSPEEAKKAAAKLLAMAQVSEFRQLHVNASAD